MSYISAHEHARLSMILHGILNELGIMELKGELVYQATGGRTSHSSKMQNAEMESLIDNLKIRSGPLYQKRNDYSKEKSDKLRKKIISQGYQIGIRDYKKMIKTVEDKWGKKFNDYSFTELQNIIGVIEREWIPYYQNKVIE